jgi:1-acyl-sn-glycerol-3-phosphate acyltransferase
MVEVSEVPAAFTEQSGGIGPSNNHRPTGEGARSHPSEERLAPDRFSDVDEWGRSERARHVFRSLYDPLYRRWFRVEWENLDTIPRHGGAMLIANHAGAIPHDAPIIMHGVETEIGRPVYGMADYFFRTVPVVGTLWARGGGVVANPHNAYRLLREQGQLALVFPEGSPGPGKRFDERYQLRRFGRGGFVEIAMRAGVPIIPIAVVGSEETMPTVLRIDPLKRLLRLPYFPVTVNMLALGPLGLLVPLPAKIKLSVMEAITFDVEPDLERYSRAKVMEAAEEIRSALQRKVVEMVSERRSVWFG